MTLRTASAALASWALVAACAARDASQIRLERHRAPLADTGPDAVALAPEERFRYGAVVGTVLTAAGDRGCPGEVWLRPHKVSFTDVRPIAAGRLRNMFRFPDLWPGAYVLGARCLGYRPVTQAVTVRRGEVLRAVVTMKAQ